MPYDAKNFEFRNMIANWATYNSARDKTNIASNCFVRGSQNVYKKISGTIANRPGQKRIGAADATFAPVNSEFIWYTSWGAVIPIWITNGLLQANFGGVWYTLLSGITTPRYVFDKWFSQTEAKDRVLMVNGNNYIQHWSGGYAVIASVTSNTLTKTNPSISWQQAGFSTTTGEKKIMIGGVEYTYTGGETTATLTGVTPDPTVPPVVAGAVAIQSVLTAASTPSAGFSNDFIKVINNQAHIGSYTSRLCYISQDTDFTNYVVPTPAFAGSPELLTLDAPLKGIGVRQGNAYIGIGTGTWAVITFSVSTDASGVYVRTTKVDVKPIAGLFGPYAHEFIDSTGDDLVYLAQDGQVRTFTDANNAFTPRYPALSLEVFTELAEENPVGGALKIIGEFTYIIFPTSGRVYLYQVRQTLDSAGQTITERLWHSPFIWNLSRIDEINGLVVGFSNANPQYYQLWNTGQWFDDAPSNQPLPYTSILALAYRGEGRRQGLSVFDKYYTEGYMTESTQLQLLINYNYQGGSNSIIAPINMPGRPAFFFGSSISGIDSLGDDSLGDDPLGDSVVTTFDVQDTIPKWKTITSLSLINCFEYQPVLFSGLAGDQWELLAAADNVALATNQDATFIINKSSN